MEFLCWPHGDHNATAHQLAIQGGYLATTSGSKQNTPDCLERIPTRIGIFHVRHNRLLSLLKVRYKLGCYLGRPHGKTSSDYTIFSKLKMCPGDEKYLQNQD